MRETRTQDIIINTQTGSEPADGPIALPVRPGRAFGGGLWPKAGALALLLGFPLGASLLTAEEKPHQPQYRFIEVPLPGQGLAYGINNRGLVTGAYPATSDPATGPWFSFLFEHGELTTGIAAPGATVTALGPANNRGVESGNYGDDTEQRPVLHDIRRGTFTPLPEIANMPLNFGNGVNDAGHVVGVAYATGDFFNGGTSLGQNWIWDGENYTFFTVPGADNGAYVGGINNRDQVSGYYVDSLGTPHGFVKDGPNYTTLDVPGALFTIVGGINNHGAVAGLYADASGNAHGFVWSPGKFVTVDSNLSGSLGNSWLGLNDHEDVAGYYKDANFINHAVIGVRVDGDKD